jgi:heme/copper-type cytochrome/quinol oxidase subunit 1
VTFGRVRDPHLDRNEKTWIFWEWFPRHNTTRRKMNTLLLGIISFLLGTATYYLIRAVEQRSEMLELSKEVLIELKNLNKGKNQ